MASYSSLSALFTAIADNIRVKLGSSENIVATDFPEKIAEIQTTPSITHGTLTIQCVNSGASDSNGSVYVAYPTVESGQYVMKLSRIYAGSSITAAMPYFPEYTSETYHLPRLAVFTKPASSSFYIDYNYGGNMAYFNTNLRPAPGFAGGSDSTMALAYTSLPRTDEPYNATITIPIKMY